MGGERLGWSSVERSRAASRLQWTPPSAPLRSHCCCLLPALAADTDIVPRVDVGSFCQFIGEVAAASPLHRLLNKTSMGEPGARAYWRA